MSESHPLNSQDLLSYLTDLRGAGVRELPCSHWQPDPQAVLESDPKGAGSNQDSTELQRATPTKPTATPPRQMSPAAPTVPPERRAHALEVLAEEVAQCERCPELARRRTQTVFGVGNPNARVCFLGEAPGADEDRLGEPFVGKAGQLLTRILEASTFQRSDVYILNTLKCRPPGNRNPEESELSQCSEYWQRQLEIIQPEFIVGLGAFAVRSLLGVDQPISRLRGRVHRYRESKVIVTYHPAYLLRNESAKRLVWEDMKLLLREMGLPIPDHSRRRNG